MKRKPTASARTDQGQFPKGTSGNPKGRPPSAAGKTLFTTDDLMNVMTGLGTIQFDKRMGTTFEVEPVGEEEAIRIYRGNDMGARLIDTRPREMFRAGFTISISDLNGTPENDNDGPAPVSTQGLGTILLGPTQYGGITPIKGEAPPPVLNIGDNAETSSPATLVTDELAVRRGMRRDERKRKIAAAAEKFRRDATAASAKQLGERVLKKFRKLGGKRVFKEALSYQAAYGGGAILIGANDGSKSWAQPLNEDAVRSVSFLTSMEPRELTPIAWYDNPLEPKFGFPKLYQLTPIPSSGALTGPRIIYVHESRLIIFQGVKVTRNQITERVGWGDSKFTRVREVLRDFGLTWSSAALIMTEFVTATMKIKGLAEAMTAEGGKKKLLARMAAVQLGKAIAKLTLIDAEGEEYTRDTASIAGLAEMLQKFMERLAAAFDIPVLVLMGQSPTGLNASGDSTIRSWYDEIATEQIDVLEEPLEKILGLILRTFNNGKLPAQWCVKFNPLWQESAKEKAETRKLDAEADDIRINQGTASNKEVRVSRYGGDEYGADIKIDTDDSDDYDPSDDDKTAYQAQLAALDPTKAKPPVPGAPVDPNAPPTLGPDGKPAGVEPAKTAMNGAQITSLIEVVTNVNTKAISRISGGAILKLAFGIDAATADTLLGPEDFVPPPPPAAPAPFGGGTPGAPTPPDPAAKPAAPAKPDAPVAPEKPAIGDK